MKKLLNSKVLMGVIFSIILMYLAFSLIAKPRIANDSAMGFLSMYSWENGSEWNYTCSLVNGQLVNSFQSWWAPGQYMIPWLFIRSFGLSLGHAIIIAEILSLLLFVFGYRRLLRSFAISDTVIHLSLVVILLGRGLSNPLFNYNADIFLFTYAVYFIQFYLWIVKKNDLLRIFLLLAFSLLGLYIKNSFIIVLFSVVLYELFSLKRYSIRTLARAAICTAVPIVVSIAIFYKFYIRSGHGIDRTGGLSFSLNNILNTLLKPAVAILSAPFSFNTAIAKVAGALSFNASNMGNWGSAELVIIALVLLPVAFFIFRPSLQKIRNAKNDPYKTMVLSFLVAYYVFYMYAILFRKNISTEDRLLLPISAIIIPWLLQYASKNKLLLTVFVLASGYSVAAYLNDVKRNLSDSRCILPNDIVIDGQMGTATFQPYDGTHAAAYLTRAEYCYFLPGKRYILITTDDAAGLLSNTGNTVAYDSAGVIKIRPGI